MNKERKLIGPLPSCYRDGREGYLRMNGQHANGVSPSPLTTLASRSPRSLSKSEQLQKFGLSRPNSTGCAARFDTGNE